MATKTINVRFQQKYDTAENWLKSEIELLAGEIAVESDTGKFKFGNGKDVFKDLPYAGIDQAQLDAIEDTCHLVNSDAERDALTKKKGDIAVVKTLIGTGTDKYSMTAYMCSPDSEGNLVWQALDGNYDASNVYFDSDLTYTATVGALKLGSGKNSDTYAAKGKSLEEVIKRIMAETIAPTISQPSYKLEGVSYNADNGNEVGSKITSLTWNGTFSDGSYSYGRSTTADGGTGNTSTTKGAGCSATYSVACDQAGTTSDGAKVDGTWTLTTPFQITGTTEATVGKLTTTCVIGDAKYWPINNINDVVDGKITGSTVTKDGTVKVTGYRGWFCGYKNGTNALADPTKISSDEVRALTKANGSWSSSMTVSQMTQMYFLAPAGKGYKPVIKDSKTDAPQTVEGPVTVYVKGANDYVAAGDETTNGGMAYDMWYVNNASAASGSATLNITKA
jgi:hypothetical protein